MGKKSKGYVPTNIIDKFIMQSGVLDVEIVCKCGHTTTRRECECRPSFFDDVEFHNYYCDSCGNFLRCDGQLTPLPAKEDVTKLTSDDSADETDYQADMRDML